MTTCSCGNALAPGVRFCTSCGQPVAAAAPTAHIADAVVAQADTASAVAQATAPAPVAAAAGSAAPGGATAVVPPPASSPPAAPSYPVPPAGPAGPAGPDAGHARLAETPGAPTEPAAWGAAPEASTTSSPYPEPVPAAPHRYDAQALSSAAERARTGVAASVQRIPLPQEQVVRALRDGALLALGSWIVCAVLLLLVDLFDEPNPRPLMWARGGVLVLALALRAPMGVTGTVQDQEQLGRILDSFNIDAVGNAGVSVTAMSFTLTLAVAAATVAVARRANRFSSSNTRRDRAIRAVLVGLAFGVVAAVLALVLRGEVTGTATLSIGADAGWMLICGAVLVAVAAFVGLGVEARAGVGLPSTWQRDVRAARDFVVAGLGASALVLLGYTIHEMSQRRNEPWAPAVTQAATTEGAGPGALALAVVLFVLFVPTLVVVAAGVLMGASVTGSAVATWSGAENEQPLLDVDRRMGIVEGTVPGSMIFAALAVALLVVAFVAVRSGVRAPAGARARWWQPALVAAGGWALLAWLASMRLDADATVSEADGAGGLNSVIQMLAGGESGGSVTADAGAGLGLAVLGAALAAALWTAVAAWIGPMVVGAVARSAPKVVAVVGGRHMDDSWRVLLADAMLRRGQQPPRHLAPVAAGLREGRIAPPQHPLV
ncbi:hypothetical protein [Agilicoccus flavus]|uniref:hypothetical protein n=1 Tax=Agilicoccus flavus TaxID=2775968 RepID=UPI001CF698B1|nr:hypothetical protein [Agilicoccus flavus]